MSMRNHLIELERKHEAIEKEIQASLSHASIESLNISRLKRQKLFLKDQIHRWSLSAETSVCIKRMCSEDGLPI